MEGGSTATRLLGASVELVGGGASAVSGAVSSESFNEASQSVFSHKGKVMRGSEGAAVSKYSGLIFHSVASAVRDPNKFRQLDWPNFAISLYVKRHFHHQDFEL